MPRHLSGLRAKRPNMPLINKTKLSSEEVRNDIKQWYALGESQFKIIKLLKAKYNIDIAQSTISRFLSGHFWKTKKPT